ATRQMSAQGLCLGDRHIMVEQKRQMLVDAGAVHGASSFGVKSRFRNRIRSWFSAAAKRDFSVLAGVAVSRAIASKLISSKCRSTRTRRKGSGKAVTAAATRSLISRRSQIASGGGAADTDSPFGKGITLCLLRRLASRATFRAMR